MLDSRRKRGDSHALFTIFLIVFIDIFGFSLILPLLPFVAERFGASPLKIGLLGASYSFFQLLASPVLGFLSDRYGRKKILILSQLGSAAGFLLLGFAHSLPLIFLSRVVDGITGGNISVAQAYIADITTKKNRAKGMGIIGAAFGLGFLFGPAIGGLLSQDGFAIPALIAVFVSLFSTLTTTLFLKETVKKKSRSFLGHFLSPLPLTSFFKSLSFSGFGLFLLIFLFLNIGQATLQAIFPLWAESRFGFGPREMGWFFTYIGLWAILIQLIIMPRLVAKIGEKTSLKIGIFLWALGFLLVPFAFYPSLLWLFMPLISLGSGLANPTLQAIASKQAREDVQGESLGVMQSAGSLGRIIGPVMGGFIFQTFGKNIPFFVGFFFFILSLVLLSHRPRPKLKLI